MQNVFSSWRRGTRRRGWTFLLGMLLAFPASTNLHGQEFFGPAPEGTGSWSRHFRIGALVGFNLQAHFSTSGQLTLPQGNPGTPGGGQNHDYDDGYVRVDATGNSGNLTWNWGYDSAAQLQGNQLAFHSVQSYDTTGTSSSATVDSGAQIGFDAAYGGTLTRLAGGTLGWEVGFGFLPSKITENQSLSANVTRLVHTYDTGGIQLPQAPYQGSYEGPGPTISDQAVETVTALAGVPLNSSQTLDVTLYNLRLGPTLQWELHPRVAVVVSAGAAIGVVTGDLKYHDTLQFADGTTADNQGESGDTQFIYGGYVSGTLLCHLVKNGDLYLGLQYLPMSSATFSGSGREAKLDLTGGLYLSAGVNWPF